MGTACQVFDVKNARNSFLSGMQVAEALIKTGVVLARLKLAHRGA